jgi:hypothetical protein
VDRDDSFLDGTNNEEQAKREFSRNVGITPEQQHHQEMVEPP